MKRVFAHIGFSAALTLLVLNLTPMKYVHIITIGLAALLLVSLGLPKFRQAKVVPICMGAAFFACLVLLGGYYGSVQPQLQLDDKTVQTEFYIVDVPEISESGDYIYTVKTVSVNQKGVPQRIKLRVRSETPIKASLYQVVKSNLKLHAISDSSFGSYGYWGKGIFMSSTADGYQLTESYVKSPWKYVLRLRTDIIRQIYEKIPNDNGSLAIALVTGNRSQVSDEVYSAFKIAGATHLMVVSGFHLTVLIGAVLFILKRLRVNDRAAALIAIATAIVCIGVAGFSKSVIRAAIMTIVMLMGNVFNKRSDGINSLGLAVALICLNPYSVSDISMLLSVTSVMSLLILEPVLSKHFGNVQKDNKIQGFVDSLAAKLSSGLSVSISVLVFTLPVMYVTFGYVSLIGLVANIIVVPLGSVSIIISVLCYVFSKIGIFTGAICWLCNGINGALIAVVKFFAGFSGAVVNLPETAGFAIAGSMIIFAICFITCKKELFRPAAVLSLILAAALLIPSAVSQNNGARVTVSEDGAVAVIYRGKAVVYGIKNSNDYYCVSSFLFSNNSEIDYIIFNDKSEYALKLANKYGCKNAVCSNFNDDIMECENIENVSVSNKFTCRSEDFSFSYYKNDNVEYCIFNINNSTMCVGLNEGSTINVCDNRVYDTNGTVNLDDGEVMYYLHGDGSYSARRIDAWQ